MGTNAAGGIVEEDYGTVNAVTVFPGEGGGLAVTIDTPPKPDHTSWYEDHDEEGGGRGGEKKKKQGGGLFSSAANALASIKKDAKKAKTKSWHEDVDDEKQEENSSPEESDEEEKTKKEEEEHNWDKEPNQKATKTKKQIEKDKELAQDALRRPHRTCCHRIFNLITFIAVVTLICLLLTQALPLFFVKGVSVLQYTLRCYVSIFCLIFILTELDAPLNFLRSSKSLQNWISRGFLYSFVGLIGAEESLAVRVQDVLQQHPEMGAGAFQLNVSWLAVFIQVSSWVMVGVGGAYFLLGICCMKGVRDRTRRDYQERMNNYKMLKARLTEE